MIATRFILRAYIKRDYRFNDRPVPACLVEDEQRYPDIGAEAWCLLSLHMPTAFIRIEPPSLIYLPCSRLASVALAASYSILRYESFGHLWRGFKQELTSTL
jgi:hypothetical protein